MEYLLLTTTEVLKRQSGKSKKGYNQVSQYTCGGKRAAVARSRSQLINIFTISNKGLDVIVKTFSIQTDLTCCQTRTKFLVQALSRTKSHNKDETQACFAWFHL